MKYSLIIDQNRDEEIIIYAREKSKIIEEIELLINQKNGTILGYFDDEIVKINIDDVSCFFVENNKILASIDDNKYIIKYRLYEIESMLNDSFIKINQSCIANIKKIKRFRASFSGTLEVIFENGYRDFISRRELKKVKERLGL